MLAKPLYRARQFFVALRPRVGPEDLALLDRYLTPRQRELFRRMPLNDQQHSFKVARRLLAVGHDNSELLQAGLLHDVGKALGPVRLWHRVASVLLAAIRPTLVERIGSRDRQSWRYPIYVMYNHGRLGAQAACEVGCSGLVQRLIQGHTSAPQDDLARALRRADTEGY